MKFMIPKSHFSVFDAQWPAQLSCGKFWREGSYAKAPYYCCTAATILSDQVGLPLSVHHTHYVSPFISHIAILGVAALNIGRHYSD